MIMANAGDDSMKSRKGAALTGKRVTNVHVQQLVGDEVKIWWQCMEPGPFHVHADGEEVGVVRGCSLHVAGMPTLIEVFRETKEV